MCARPSSLVNFTSERPPDHRRASGGHARVRLRLRPDRRTWRVAGCDAGVCTGDEHACHARP
eukprot:scaffold16587_cov141-Isochrysis_galbana.AAC.4